jgi:WD40 repeat protein
VSFSPDGLRLTSSSRGEIKIWNLKTGKTETNYNEDLVEFVSVVFTPDG